jgi:hypothetical protein
LPASYLEAGHLGHGYALTVHKAQGLTVERAYVLATEALTKEAGYVALSRARDGSELFVALGEGPDELGHDPRQRLQDPSADLARRLASSRAKQLASTELESARSPAGRTSAVAPSLSEAVLSACASGGPLRFRVYREAPQIEVGSGNYADDPTTDETQSRLRHRSLDDAVKLADEARERVEAERDSAGRLRPTPEHDRSWGLGR